jgi:hypothetical protein
LSVGQVEAVLAWSATVTDGDQHTGAAISVVPVPCEPAHKQPLDADLGTTDSVTVSSWATENRHVMTLCHRSQTHG